MAYQGLQVERGCQSLAAAIFRQPLGYSPWIRRAGLFLSLHIDDRGAGHGICAQCSLWRRGLSWRQTRLDVPASPFGCGRPSRSAPAAQESYCGIIVEFARLPRGNDFLEAEVALELCRRP